MKFGKHVFLSVCLFCLSHKMFAEDASSQSELKAAIVTNYANILAAQYEDSFQKSLRLQTVIETFLQKPSAETLAAARTEWVVSREPYSQTEIARFYDGPIEPLEEYINAWPVDQNYIDYTAGMPDSGIINQLKFYPQLTTNILIGANQKVNGNFTVNGVENETGSGTEKDDEKAVSTGFHAIEFLLWGQDLYADTPGRRAYTDYVAAPNGPGLHASRRCQYLRLLTQLLSGQLQTVAGQWATNNPGNYRERFLALAPDAALEKIFTGVGNLSSSELAGERMLVPYTTKSQENEQCCFSDTTHLDLLRNELGVQDVWLGTYTRVDGSTVSGPGLIALLATADSKLAATLKQQLTDSLAAIQAIPKPFDQAILGDDSAPGRVAIKKALDALQAQNNSIVQAAAILDVRLNLKN